MQKKKKMLIIIGNTLLLLICFFVGLYVFGVKSEPYRFALKFIDSNRTIVEKVGKVKKRRLAIFGYSVKYSGPNGYADYKILLKGELGKGTIFLKLEKSIGEWEVLKANLKLSDNKVIHLID